MREADKVSVHLSSDIEKCQPNCHVTVKLEPYESEKCEIANKNVSFASTNNTLAED